MSDPSKKAEGQATSGMTRRDLLKIGAASGAATVVGAALGTVPTPAAAQGVPVCSGLNAIEAYPVSPLILRPFTDPLPIPQAVAPETAATVASWPNQPGPGVGQQDVDGGTHQFYPGQVGTFCENMPQPVVYRLKLEVGEHSYSSSPVRTLVPYVGVDGNTVPAGTVVPQLPKTTIYGFNGQFPGPMINAEYGKPNLVRFENHLDENPLNLDRGDFGDPELGFLTHLHNGHTAPESDGNPHHKPEAYQPGDWVDNLYLNYPAGGDENEKQSFLWFHDHREGHTGANVYKGMAGLYPIYDPILDPGDETRGLRLPGVRRNNPDGTFNVDYDIPLAIHDVALDDGDVPHQDFHNGCGESHPEWWGKSFFRHFPNHGFVGDVFCVNGVAFPVLTVKRRKYRFRFLTAAIARQFELSFMRSTRGPIAAVDLGYTGGELQGQYRLPDARLALRQTQIATGGGLLPSAIVRDAIENWPGMRHEVVIDFTKWIDGRATRKGEVVWLVNTMKMLDGRKANNSTRLGNDPRYKTPVMKIIIGDDAPDASIMPRVGRPLRPMPSRPADLASLPRRTFDLERGGFGGEIQWLINGHPFEPTVPLAVVKRGQPEVWTVKTAGGWSHPMHFHQEEHQVLTRDGQPAELVAGHADDLARDDIIALDAGEEVSMYRNFRTFTGKYVAHCHNLAHEDHSMMFGWIIEP
ncbi:MAG: multicopper oxidase domain-containing protein [Anaeromyxobacter sp.]|nr:multicopper oxidase domain-containing protein [Anaeromyxobacter sp.]MBL0275994.1 multicopper oxidase domain-containing protein [Anaeromyxobacter sp.]